MAKLTLLEIVQDILNDTDSDPVNSINGTVESLQVAQIVKTTFFEIIANRNWPHLRNTILLDNVLDTDRPTYLKLPARIKELLFFNYNKRRDDSPTKARYDLVSYKEPEDFLQHSNRLNSLEDNVLEITDFGGIKFLVRNDVQPQFYTSFDDEYIVCDSYDVSFENTLQSSQSQALVYQEPLWVNDDSAVPDLPAEAFPALLAEAKSAAFVVLKQQVNSKEEQRAGRQQRWLSRKAWKVSGGVKYPDYGRARRKPSSRRSTLIDKDGTLNVM